VRLLYVIDSLAPFGAEQSLTALAPRYRARGIDVDVAYLKEGPGLLEALQAGGARCFRVDGGGRIGRMRSVRALIEHRRPDLVHTTLFEADIAGRMAAAAARVPVVSSLVSEPYGREHAEDPRIVAWRLRGAQLIDGATARLVRRFHALTSHSADVMGRRLRIGRSRIEVIPRGRDHLALGTRDPERTRRVRRSLGIETRVPLILAVARQEHQKGLDVLLRALPGVLAELPTARLLIAGREGGQTPMLRMLTRDLGLERAVCYLGVRWDVPDLLAAADAFAFPSRFEGFGCAVLEAMAMEAPIVASDLPPVHEVVGPDRPALLVPPNDPCALGRAIVAALLDGTGAAHRTEVARARFLEQFTIDRVADDMVGFYERSLAEGGA
jgi:glycosyltransferase involved in cell wall biosynthesis